jgi:hypothetical protein
VVLLWCKSHQVLVAGRETVDRPNPFLQIELSTIRKQTKQVAGRILRSKIWHARHGKEGGKEKKEGKKVISNILMREV